MKQLYLIKLADNRCPYIITEYAGTYKTEEHLVRLNIDYYWDSYKELIRKRSFFRSSKWAEGWSKRTLNKTKIVPSERIVEIAPITLREIRGMYKEHEGL